MISKIFFFTIIGIIFICASSEDIFQVASEKCKHINNQTQEGICRLEYVGMIDKNGKFNQTRALEVVETIKSDGPGHEARKEAFKICISKLNGEITESMMKSFGSCMGAEVRRLLTAKGIIVEPESESQP